MYETIVCLIRAGWSCLAWSDGTTANLTGTVPGPYAAGPSSPDSIFPLTGTFQASGSSGTNGLGNTRAWALLRQPIGSGSQGNYEGTRMIVVQRGTTSHVWKIKYSKAGQYDRGLATNQNAPSVPASTIPSDDVTVAGGGTDASPTFSTIFLNTLDGVARHNVVANDGLSGETAPFGFWAVSFPAGGGNPAHGFLFDPMINGTTAPQDADPFVFFVDTNAGSEATFVANQANSYGDVAGGVCTAWFRYGMQNAGQEFNSVGALSYAYRNSIAYSQIVPGAAATYPLGVNSHNSNDDLFPVAYARSAVLGGLAGYKGVSSLVSWVTTERTTGDTFTLSTVRDRIYMRSVVLQWDGSVPAV